jgi:hypothetical protein
MSDIDPQEFGRLQAQVERLLESDRVKTELLETMSVAIQAIQLQLATAKGGWKALMLLGGAAATLGGFVTWALQHFSGKGMP